jgi:hypothetical protein
MMTLWCIARSPLFLGANLTRMDGFTKSLLTNPGLIAVDQQSVNNKLEGQDGDIIAWTADSSTGPSNYLALFNVGEESVKVESTFGSYGFPNTAYKLRDVWMRKELGDQPDVSVELPAHGAVLLELKP